MIRSATIVAALAACPGCYESERPGPTDTAAPDDAGDDGRPCPPSSARTPLDLGTACGGRDTVGHGDVIEVRVVDDRHSRGAGDPVGGVRVVAVDSGGSREATTCDDGTTRLGGLDLAGDPPDLTFSADGFPVLTITSLGSTGPVPEPLEVGLGSLDFC